MNFLAKLMYQYRLKGRPDPYKEISRLVQHKTAIPTTGKKILVVPYRVNTVSNLFEGNVTLNLKNRGYEVDALLCGAAVEHCDSIDAYTTKWPRCKMCVYEQNKFIDTFGANPIWINRLINNDDNNEVENFINQSDFKNTSNLIFRNINIEKQLKSALQLYYKAADVPHSKYPSVFISFLRTIAITIIVLDKYFEKNKVEFVLLSHGVYSTWGAVQEYCLSRKIDFVTWGREYNGAGIIAAHNQSYLNEPLYEENSIWDKDNLTSAQRRLALDYLEAKVGIKDNNYDYVYYHGKTKRILSEDFIRDTLGIGSSKVIGLFPNIPWDGQTFRPNNIFSGINSWIFETIEFFRNKKDVYLIIRSHPAESAINKTNCITTAELINNHFGDTLPSNVIILPPDSVISSLSIASISNGCVLYGSTVGYETTFIRKPTILASVFFYSNKDISFDPKTKDEYFLLISKALSGNLTVDDERFERLLQYTYHYQFRRILPENLIKLERLYFAGCNFKNRDDFFADKSINKFVDSCFNKEKFYFDEFYK